MSAVTRNNTQKQSENTLDILGEIRVEPDKAKSVFQRTKEETAKKAEQSTASSRSLNSTKPARIDMVPFPQEKPVITRSDTLKALHQLESTFDQIDEIFLWGSQSEIIIEALPLIEKVNSQIQALNPAKLTHVEFEGLRKKIHNFLSRCEKAEQVLESPIAPFENTQKLNAKGIILNNRLLVQTTLKNLVKEITGIIKKSNQTYSHRILGHGICHGDVLALMEQEFTAPDENTEARARYIHSCYLQNKRLSERDFKKIGRRVLLGNSPVKTLVLQKVANRFGLNNYSVWVQSKIGTDDVQSQLKNEHILRVVGRICYELSQKYYRDSPNSVETAELNDVVSNSLNSDIDFENPATFIKKTNIKTYKLIQDKIDADNLKKQLAIAIENPGEYRISYRTKSGGHAVYVAYDPNAKDHPYKFCDINDRTFDSLPIVRGFGTKNELLQFIHPYLKSTYSLENPDWSLAKIGKTEVSNPIELLMDRIILANSRSRYFMKSYEKFAKNYDGDIKNIREIWNTSKGMMLVDYILNPLFCLLLLLVLPTFRFIFTITGFLFYGIASIVSDKQPEIMRGSLKRYPGFSDSTFAVLKAPAKKFPVVETAPTKSSEIILPDSDELTREEWELIS